MSNVRVGDTVTVAHLGDIEGESTNWAKTDHLEIGSRHTVMEITDDGWFLLDGKGFYHRPERFCTFPFEPTDIMEGETRRHNEGKPQLSYILEFDYALDLVAGVMERGAKTYSRGNWKLGGRHTELASLLDSAMRHLKDRQSGEVYDPKMGTDHLANAACNILFALYHHGQEPKGE